MASAKATAGESRSMVLQELTPVLYPIFVCVLTNFLARYFFKIDVQEIHLHRLQPQVGGTHSLRSCSSTVDTGGWVSRTTECQDASPAARIVSLKRAYISSFEAIILIILDCASLVSHTLR